MSVDPAHLQAIVTDPQQSEYRRRDALRELLRQRDPGAVALGVSLSVALLRDPETFLRREAAKVLADRAEHDDDAGVHALAERAGDADEEVRRHVVRGLAAAADPAHRSALEALSNDRSYFVKRDAQRALEALGALGGAPPTPAAQAAPPAHTSSTGREGEQGSLAGRRPPWERDSDDAGGGDLTTPTRPDRLTPSPGLTPARRLEPRAKSPHLSKVEDLRPVTAIASRPNPETDAAPPERRAPRRPSKQHPKPSTTPEPLVIRTNDAEPSLSAAAQKILKTVRKRAGVREATGRRDAGTILDKVKERAGVKRPERNDEKLRIRKTREEIDRHRTAPQIVAAGRCSKCGWALRAGQKFCVFCGAVADPTGAQSRDIPKPQVPAHSRHTVGVSEGHGSARRPQRTVQRHRELTGGSKHRRAGFPGGTAGCLAAVAVIVVFFGGAIVSFVSTMGDVRTVSVREALRPGTLVTLRMPSGENVSGILVRQQTNNYDLWHEETQETIAYTIRDAGAVTGHGPSGATARDLARYRSKYRRSR